MLSLFLDNADELHELHVWGQLNKEVFDWSLSI